MTNENSVVLRNYCIKVGNGFHSFLIALCFSDCFLSVVVVYLQVTAGPMEYEAQENWKSLRTMSMNELVYIDDRIKIARNCGALRIYFLYERI